jgi:hypothetical protein
VPSRPDTESIPSSVDQRDVTLRCQMLSRPNSDFGV